MGRLDAAGNGGGLRRLDWARFPVEQLGGS